MRARCEEWGRSSPAIAHEPMTFGSYIRERRQRAGLTMSDLATRVGVSSSHYGRVEVGEKAPLPQDRWHPLLQLGADASVLRRLADDYRRARRDGRRPRAKSQRDAVAPGLPGSSSWDKLPWEDDDWCWYAVACHPGGLTIEEVAALTGLSSERVRQIEQEALAKLAVEPSAVEAMEVIDDKENEFAIWTVAANMR